MTGVGGVSDTSNFRLEAEKQKKVEKVNGKLITGG